MLVLSRKRNEQIVIDDDIVITVVEIRGDKVRLGVEAPKEVPVHRREVYDAIQQAEENARRAAKGLPPLEKPTPMPAKQPWYKRVFGRQK